VIKDCVPTDDLVFPLLLNKSSPDYAYHFHGPASRRAINGQGDTDGHGDIDGKDIEYHLFRLGTGIDWDVAEFERAAARVLNLERALQVRYWGRNRSVDESALPYFDQPEGFANRLLGKRYQLDRRAYKEVLDEFYTLHGWDPKTGVPTRKRLVELGLGYVANELSE
jgi:aldehyde:ferredoxin oxidoreductase